MIGVVIASHGQLATAVMETVELITGRQDYVESIGLKNTDPGTEFNQKLKDKIDGLRNQGCEEVLVLLDLIGGTPCNQTIELMREHKFHAITGVNLPMAIAVVLEDRENITMEDLVSAAIEQAKEGIVDLYDIL